MPQLCDVKVQMDESFDIDALKMPAVASQDMDAEPPGFLPLQLLFKDEYCVLQTKEGCAFGILNKRVFRSLARLTCFPDLEYTDLIAWNAWQERIFPGGKDSKRRCIGLDINISGPRCELDATARGLSRAQLFLQPPHYGTSNLPYQNPQYLDLPGLVQVLELPIFSNSQTPSAGAHTDSGDNKALVENDGYPDFDKILEELPRHDYLKEAVVDIRVTTKLLR
jgi:SWI/SNF-related matrix-associated actin-dependent regulator of chromatin subfamily A3